jgi:hypothetical protein
LIALVAITITSTITSTALGAQEAQQQQKAHTLARQAIVYYGGEIARFQRETWHWQRLMGARLTPSSTRRLDVLSPLAARRAAVGWAERLAQVHKRAKHPPHLRQFLCIHRYEGSWTDTGAPYYGGLQMDVGFQQHYGGWLYVHKGTANHWSPLEQIWTAEKALKTRGFWPWPNTARYCGLI